jgi:MFS transporter, CP family, cyanate transporter
VQRRSLVVTLFCAGFALRPQIVGIGPLLPRIERDLHVSHAVAGLLATIPVLCMGVFAPLAPRMLRTFGTARAVSLALALVAAAGIVRALVPGAALVLLATVPVGIGIAIAGTLLPVVVKEAAADRPTLATGAYTAGINVGATLAAVLAAPIAAAAGWRTALVVFSAAAGVVLVVWLRTHASPAGAAAAVVRLPVGRPVVWLVAAVFALQSILFYGFNAWLAESYEDRGWSATAAGGLLAVANGVALVAGIATAYAADRVGSRRLYLATGAASATAAASLVAADVPGAWAWAFVLGVAIGVVFTIVMTLPLDVSHGPADVAATTSLVLGVGYLVSALAPAALGAVRDATGGFTTPLALLAGDALLLLLLVPLLSARRLSSRSPGAASGRRDCGA